MGINKNIDCVFLIPSNSKKSYQKLSEIYSAIEPPTWALLLAQSVRSVNFKPLPQTTTSFWLLSIASTNFLTNAGTTWHVSKS